MSSMKILLVIFVVITAHSTLAKQGLELTTPVEAISTLPIASGPSVPGVPTHVAWPGPSPTESPHTIPPLTDKSGNWSSLAISRELPALSKSSTFSEESDLMNSKEGNPTLNGASEYLPPESKPKVVQRSLEPQQDQPVHPIAHAQWFHRDPIGLLNERGMPEGSPTHSGTPADPKPEVTTKSLHNNQDHPVAHAQWFHRESVQQAQPKLADQSKTNPLIPIDYNVQPNAYFTDSPSTSSVPRSKRFIFKGLRKLFNKLRGKKKPKDGEEGEKTLTKKEKKGLRAAIRRFWNWIRRKKGKKNGAVEEQAKMVQKVEQELNKQEGKTPEGDGHENQGHDDEQHSQNPNGINGMVDGAFDQAAEMAAQRLISQGVPPEMARAMAKGATGAIKSQATPKNLAGLAGGAVGGPLGAAAANTAYNTYFDRT